MNRFLAASLLSLSVPLLCAAQTPPEVIHLWPNGAPGFESRKDQPEQAKDWWVKNVNNPSLTIFRPAPGKANGCAVIIAPGGGFQTIVFNAEGKQPAQFLNTLGVTAFALKYRLPFEAHSPYTLKNVHQDARRAVRLVRSRAAEFDIDPHRVGFLGFSAGGGMAMMVSFEKGDGDPKARDPVDRLNSRPDFEMMIYPGGNVPRKIPRCAPPAFLLCANDDDYHCDRVTLELFEKFRRAGVPVEAHFLERGKHAFNMGDRSPYLAVRHWPDRMADWLSDRGYLKPAASPEASSLR